MAAEGRAVALRAALAGASEVVAVVLRASVTEEGETKLAYSSY